MNRQTYYLSATVAGIITMVGDLMGASSISQGARATPTYGGSNDKRDKGKRHRSLTERSNRRKAKARSH